MVAPSLAPQCGRLSPSGGNGLRLGVGRLGPAARWSADRWRVGSLAGRPPSSLPGGGLTSASGGRCGSASLAPRGACCQTQPSTCRLRRTGQAETSRPCMAWRSAANGAQCHCIRPLPYAGRAALSQARRVHVSHGMKTAVWTAPESRPSEATRLPRLPVRYARTSRYALACEHNRKAVISGRFRPTAQSSTRWNTRREPYRARRRLARIYACSSWGMSRKVRAGIVRLLAPWMLRDVQRPIQEPHCANLIHSNLGFSSNSRRVIKPNDTAPSRVPFRKHQCENTLSREHFARLMVGVLCPSLHPKVASICPQKPSFA